MSWGCARLCQPGKVIGHLFLISLRKHTTIVTRVCVGDSLLIQKPIKRIKSVKTCFSTLIVANTRGYCGETIVRISLDLSIIFSPFYEAPLAQKHFAAPSRVIQTPTGAILHSRPGAVAHSSTHSTDILAISNS